MKIRLGLTFLLVASVSCAEVPKAHRVPVAPTILATKNFEFYANDSKKSVVISVHIKRYDWDATATLQPDLERDLNETLRKYFKSHHICEIETVDKPFEGFPPQ